MSNLTGVTNDNNILINDRIPCILVPTAYPLYQTKNILPDHRKQPSDKNILACNICVL